MSTLTGYTKIADGTGATPSVFNSRYSLLHQNVDILNADKLETVTTGDIAIGAVGNDQLATNAVSSGKIQAEAVTGAKIATSSVITCSTLNAISGFPSGVKLINNATVPNYVKLTYGSGSALHLIQFITGESQAESVWVTSNRRMKTLGETPASSTSAAQEGEFSASSQYFFYAVSANSWKRAALTGW